MNRFFDEKSPVFIVAEIGSNFDGSFETAKALIHAAHRAGADAVKFQLFQAEEFVHPVHEPEMFEAVKKNQLPREWVEPLKREADSLGLVFFATPFDLPALRLLDDLGIPIIKIASGDLTYAELLQEAARLKKPLFLSTGMAYFEEIERAIGIIESEGHSQIVLLHCTSSYPAAPEEVRIYGIRELQERFPYPVGFSDHSLGTLAPLAAVTLGARVVEKHFTPSRSLQGPDHPHSLEPEEFRRMTEEIRKLEKMLEFKGNQITEKEALIRHRSRRGLYARHPLAAGSVLSSEGIRALRPEKGVGSQAWPRMTGQPIQESLKPGDVVTEATASPGLRERVLDQSWGWYGRAKRVIPSCTQTFSKGTTQYVKGVAPIYLERGRGCHVFDVDGNEYIDYVMALGPVILGYCYPAVDRAIERQLSQGITFTLPHPLEVKVAEKLLEVIPCAEGVRFAKNGSDATTGALRAARAFTGRERVAACGYHGWHDWYIASTARDKGVPCFTKELIRTFEYNHIDSLKKIFTEYPTQIAAVILEPLGVEEPQKDFLSEVRALAHAHGALLIFDEIISGFKIAIGGAQEYYGVVPDLACFGKAMANGMPLSAVVGRREVMQIFDQIFFSFTFGGETLSLAAALATIGEFQTKHVMAHLWRQGEKLKRGYNRLVEELGLESYTRCVGLAPRTIVTFQGRDEQEMLRMKSLFQQECLKRDVLFIGVHHLSFSHTDEDIERTLEVYSEALKILKRGLEEENIEKYMEGEFIQPIFRRF